MRQILLKALASGLIMSLFPHAAISAPPKPAHADSLLTLLPKTPDAAGRERIYVQLADLSGDSLELAAPHWEAALAEAHKAGDTYGCKDALDFLVRKFADRDTGPRNTSPSRTAFSRVPATPCSVHRFTPTTSGNR